MGRAKKGKIAASTNVVKKEEKQVLEEEDPQDEDMASSSSADCSDDSTEEIGNEEMDAFDQNVDDMERLNFDFEAFPPDEGDTEGILDLLTQIFLRVNIDCEELAKQVVGLSPFGCVFKPAEENEDDEVGSLVYGVVTMLDLLREEKCFGEIREFLLQRAAKHATGPVVKALTEAFARSDGKRLGFLVNERMIHFPAQIAGPAFQSLRSDLSNMPKNSRYDLVLIILKIRLGSVKAAAASATASGDNFSQPSSSPTKKRKRLGKAAKKRLVADQYAASDVIYDNAEEELLFKGCQDITTPFINFFYPVQSDVEKTSKFHGTLYHNTIYRPYRRVCLLTAEQFDQFAQQVQGAFSA